MMISEKGISLIKKNESLKLEAYVCPAGKWTIGYGHTLGVKASDVITKEEAEKILKRDLIFFEHSILKLVKVPINQNQFDALVSFSFNVGITAFCKSTLLKKLNARDYAGAAEEFGRWVMGGGVKLYGLIKRRAEEKKLFEGAE
jgi:lysozyme